MSDLGLAAEIYAATFAGSTDAYATFNEHWVAVREPLTPEVVLRAFETNVPISGYVLTQDSTTHIAALDIDRDNGYEMGVRFAKVVGAAGGMAYVERSSRGCHVWIILEYRLPAIVVRRGLKAFISEADLPPCPGGAPTQHPKTGRPVCPGCMRSTPDGTNPTHDDPKIELRPAGDRLPLSMPDEQPKLGHCIRLATMPHHRTGKRSPLIDPYNGSKLSGKLTELVSQIDLTKTDVFIAASQRAPLPEISAPPVDVRFRFGPPPGDDSASSILRDRWGVMNARPGRTVRCPAHDDKHASLSILRDDQRAICKTGGCELENDGHGRGTYELQTMAHQ